MSELTHTALDQAIRDHISDEAPGALCTGWLLVAANVTSDQLRDDITGYTFASSTHLPLHAALGLATVLDHHLIDGLGDDE